MTTPYGHPISYVMILLMTMMKMAKVPMTRRRLSEMRRIRVKPVGEKPQLWNWAKLAAKLCVNSGLVKPFLRLLAGNSSSSKLKNTSTFWAQLCCVSSRTENVNDLVQNEMESISVSLNFVNLYSSCILTPLNSHNFLFCLTFRIISHSHGWTGSYMWPFFQDFFASYFL